MTNQLTTDHDLSGWDIGAVAALEWSPWGSRGDARAKVLADGGRLLPGPRRGPARATTATPTSTASPRCSTSCPARLRTQGVEMGPGDAYVAAAGSVHTDFATDGGATYLSIFKL